MKTVQEKAPINGEKCILLYEQSCTCV